MKSKINILLLILFISCKSKGQKLNSIDYKLVGKVKSIKTKSYNALKINDSIYKEPFEFKGYYGISDDYYLLFNKDRFLIKKMEFDSNGNKSLELEILYDNNGKAKKQLLFAENENGSKKYDTRGNLSKHYFYNSEGKLMSKLIYKYDKNDNLIETFNDDEFAGFKSTYLYDEDMNLKTYNRYDETNKNTNRIVYFYDNKGNIFKEESYLANSENKNEMKKNSVTEYKLDNKNNILQEIIKDVKGNILTVYEHQYI